MTIAYPPLVQGSPASLTSAAVDLAATHRHLALANRRRLRAGSANADWRAVAAEEYAIKLIEGEMIDAARAEIADQAASAPTEPGRFVEWFNALEHDGPGQGDPLFPWLRDSASPDAFHWFLTQEVAGEAGFDDLVALTQVKMPQGPKLEFARNYWDEMGRGNPKGMHGPMLERLATYLGVAPEIGSTVWPALALANTMVALVTNRPFAYHAVGALGVIELTAPGRAAFVAAGLARIGVPVKARHYFELHAVLDRQHSKAWNAEIIRPLVAEDPQRATAIAEGALMRLKAGARCFDSYRAYLWAGGIAEPPE